MRQPGKWPPTVSPRAPSLPAVCPTSSHARRLEVIRPQVAGALDFGESDGASPCEGPPFFWEHGKHVFIFTAAADSESRGRTLRKSLDRAARLGKRHNKIG
ncbi:hypothetical protein AAFF_G00286060 [Aldrovandia affinis]|uniref:Uncharacterized protein n=1 Tax=Aldrovandia affinis TaxID=143900 RepID=A0AAD7TAH7_9TELE|nr:hypothetical protein AAFF_G00286060 [Aldrovandia affinis]